MYSVVIQNTLVLPYFLPKSKKIQSFGKVLGCRILFPVSFLTFYLGITPSRFTETPDKTSGIFVLTVFLKVFHLLFHPSFCICGFFIDLFWLHLPDYEKASDLYSRHRLSTWNYSECLQRLSFYRLRGGIRTTRLRVSFSRCRLIPVFRILFPLHTARDTDREKASTQNFFFDKFPGGYYQRLSA